MHDLAEDIACQKEVAEVLYWDDKYRKELAKRKYLQETRMLPVDEPVTALRKDYHIPTAGVDLALAMRNLSKNVSTWKKRIGESKHPDAEQKHAMYVLLYQEARTKVAAERAHIQSQANEFN